MNWEQICGMIEDMIIDSEHESAANIVREMQRFSGKYYRAHSIMMRHHMFSNLWNAVYHGCRQAARLPQVDR